jgi:hypothetical protein
LDSLRAELYAALALYGSTLKDWFVRSAQGYCGNVHQVGLFEEAVDPSVPHPEEAQPT